MLQSLARQHDRHSVMAVVAAEVASEAGACAGVSAPAPALELSLQQIMDQIPPQVLANATDVEIISPNELQLGRLLGNHLLRTNRFFCYYCLLTQTSLGCQH